MTSVSAAPNSVALDADGVLPLPQRFTVLAYGGRVTHPEMLAAYTVSARSPALAAGEARSLEPGCVVLAVMPETAVWLPCTGSWTHPPLTGEGPCLM